MSELRRDPVAGRWVIVNTEDSWSPDAYPKTDNSPHRAGASPFVYKREGMTPPEVDSFRLPDTQPNTSGWSVRVVPNKFPALQIEGGLDKRGLGMFDVSNGVGAHEVVIETPDPIKQFANYSHEETTNVLTMYQRRCQDLAKDPRFKYVVVFKNFGDAAGASIEHAHSQIIALPMIPKYVQEKLNGAQEYYQYKERGLFTDMIDQEQQDKERIISENNDFIAFCPFVPRFSFETWIMPKDSGSKFINLDHRNLHELAGTLLDVLKRIRNSLDNPAYNFYLNIDPINLAYEETFLWHIEIVPKLTAGNDIGVDSGFPVIQTDPKDAARFLREAL